MTYTAKLIDASGKVQRSWSTRDVDTAMTADRNCPIGWRVVIE